MTVCGNPYKTYKSIKDKRVAENEKLQIKGGKKECLK